MVHIAVEDTGIGIPAHMTDHIFGEFNQVENERNRQFDGTGLGLAITKRLVTLMNGEIWVTSEEGVGSCFGFKMEMQANGAIDTAYPTLPRQIRRVMVDEPLRKMRVLAAEDNLTNQLVFTKMVKSLNITLEFATNGEEAVAQYQTLNPDLVFMDISMPRMDGKQPRKFVKLRPARANTYLSSQLQHMRCPTMINQSCKQASITIWPSRYAAP